VHGTGDIPPDFSDPAHPDWVEAARWLQRQRELYRLQKLLLLRVRLIKEALGGWLGGVGEGCGCAGRWTVVGERLVCCRRACLFVRRWVVLPSQAKLHTFFSLCLRA